MMGCIQSSPSRSRMKEISRAMARSEEIDIQLHLHSLRAKNEINILVLGAGESDQTTTLLRQIKLLHLGGYSDQERNRFKEVIFSNIIASMRAVLEAMPQLELRLYPHNDARRATILSLPPQIEVDILPRDIADVIRGLWRGVKEAVHRSHEFQLNDSAPFFFNAIDRIAAPDYMPTDQDILRSRVKPKGIAETIFQVGELTYKVVDPSGQRSERKKWLHCFENVKAIIFYANLGDYDQMLYEDESVNRLQEALTKFDSMCNSRWFVKTSIILFLKIDTFAEKLERSPLADYFPDYTGGNNYDAACDYLLHRFVSLNQSAATKQIYAHYISAEDAQQIKFVLSSIQDILLQNHLREQGLLDR
ncbi:heterotrimeric G protein alpha subunit B [Mycena rebaudengoi]|nr:heterotrimeric G protein alpha subunit B [Mycena rebaudengoi]